MDKNKAAGQEKPIKINKPYSWDEFSSEVEEVYKEIKKEVINLNIPKELIL